MYNTTKILIVNNLVNKNIKLFFLLLYFIITITAHFEMKTMNRTEFSLSCIKKSKNCLLIIQKELTKAKKTDDELKRKMTSRLN